ncbi:ABC transporter substrate-binding protein [Myxacorys almedinensis]|uniref:ABC transporter substrate-binding protein n=1 Tax=Myxacorys almedinensis A TaxID=2690445 RepID=A0A8J7Z832_9CYAN|nr:iron-siderophore ABC transporter substrate-binding protein [Myxacorys almedinensis]NDJ19763.1 ABC transporter substrate-binding protein [Myxacorys almedinensis A]
MGQTCVPNNPKRVVTISYEILVRALALGIKPIGSTGEEWNETHLSSQYYPYLGNKVGGIKYVGFSRNVNLEKILLLKPDLILAWEDAGKIYPLLSQIAPTLIIPTNDLDWKEGFNITAELLNKEQKAQEVWNHYYQRIDRLKTAFGNRYQNQRISIVTAVGETAYIFVKNSFAGSILEDLGLQRPLAQNVSVPDGVIPSISEERLDLIDADILFFMGGDNRNGEDFARFQKRPFWQTLTAVQQKKVYPVEYVPWIGDGPLAADAVIDDLYRYLVNTP